jgi:8-oxo-dGTP diphosphatase
LPFTYRYPRPALTVDCVVFGLGDDDLKVLLIQRDHDPYVGRWALPGGFVDIDETLEHAARRELEEEAGLHRVFLEQLFTFGAVDRDPRERVVTVAYYALVNIGDHAIRPATDARAVAWFDVNDAPKLAFDHETILDTALERLKGKVRYQPIGFELLPRKFTLRHLQRLYETVLERRIDKRNFRRKVLSMGLLEETDEIETGVSHRAARLYRFDASKYKKLVNKDFNFEL